MKIRRYKGPSLEKLYEAIQQELGPEAVVVSPSVRPKGMNRLLSPFLGGEPHELIAVVDDASADRQVLAGAAGGEDVRRLSKRQEQKWEDLDGTLREMRSELGGLIKHAGGLRPGLEKDVPAFAADWDPLFLRATRQAAPGIFECDKRDLLRVAVTNQLRVEENFPILRDKSPHILVLTGPTGSGKTTTLAKLAARWSLDHKLKVGIVTTDTYRVAAVDQIKEYATLLGLDIRVAFSAGEAARAAREMADRDVILVDTPGRNHYDRAGLTGLRGLLQGMGAVTVLMMLPATSDRRNVAEMLEHFAVLNLNYLVITKIDETRHYDVLTAAACCSTCPVAFLTDGQRVPQDIHAARMDELVGMLVPEEKASG